MLWLAKARWDKRETDELGRNVNNMASVVLHANAGLTSSMTNAFTKSVMGRRAARHEKKYKKISLFMSTRPKNHCQKTHLVKHNPLYLTMVKRNSDSQKDIYVQPMASSLNFNRPLAIPRSVGGQFHASPVINQTDPDRTNGFSDESMLSIRKRQVTAPLQSHLEKKTIQMLMEGSRKLSRSTQKTQTNSPVNTSHSSVVTCQDCERIINNKHEELAVCEKCSTCVCPTCCIKVVYSGGAVDTILCLRCT